MAEKPVTRIPDLVIPPLALSYCSDERGRSLGCQVWETEAPAIEPQGYSKLELVFSGTRSRFICLCVCSPAAQVCGSEETMPREPQTPEPGPSTRPAFPKLSDQKKPPSVSSCHSNLLRQRGDPLGKGPARTQAAPFLCSPSKGSGGHCGGQAFPGAPLTILPGR